MENKIEQNITDLQNQLKELKLKKDYDSLIEKYNELKEKFEGKCFASKGLRIHTLEDYSKLHNLGMFKCTKVCILDSFCSPTEYTINSLEDYKSITYKEDLQISISGESIDIHVHNGDVSLYIREKNHYQAHNFPMFKYEIDETVYNNIKHIVTQSVNNILSYPVKGAYTYLPGTTKTAELKKLGYKFITINSDEAYVLSTHPFVYGNELLVSEASVQILQNLIKEEERLDRLDINTQFAGYPIKRLGVHRRHLDSLYSIIDRVQKEMVK